jgi:hypothetical protein
MACLSFIKVTSSFSFSILHAERGRDALVVSSASCSCDYPFLELLEEDFEIPRYALVNALMGAPPAPKKEAT